MVQGLISAEDTALKISQDMVFSLPEELTRFGDIGGGIGECGDIIGDI